MRDMNSLDKNSLEYAIKQLSATFAAVHGVKVVHDYENQYAPAVSYTHLTLPTIYSV